MTRIPVTVLTGFLGSGKTTLLNRILTERHGQRIAVIENEFGAIGIDQALVVQADEEVFEMNNGCICCTVRGDLIRILGKLVQRRDRFDRVLVETTGLADPGPVAQTFFVDDEVKEHFALDGIVTLVDARHAHLHLDDASECREQIAFADVLVLNKTDLVSGEELAALERRIAAMNGVARRVHARHADVPLPLVLDVGGFDLDRALAAKPTFLEPEYPFEWAATLDLEAGHHELVLGPGPDATMDVLAATIDAGAHAADRAHTDRALRRWSEEPRRVPPRGVVSVDAPTASRLALEGEAPYRFGLRLARPSRIALYTEHLAREYDLRVRTAGVDVPVVTATELAPGHTHDDEIGSVGLHTERPVDLARLDQWLGVLLRERGADIFRMKGIVNVADSDRRFVFQGVHMLFDGREDRPWAPNERRATDLVFIGRELDGAALERSFEVCLVG